MSEIEARLDDLERRAELAEKQRDEYHRLYLEMMERCRKLELGIVGSKSEHLPPSEGQLALDVLGMMLGDRERAEIEAAVNEEIKVPEHTRPKPTGRKPLPENLWRVEIEIVPLDVQRAGLDAYERIGEEVTETLERRPGCFVVVKSIRPNTCSKIAIATSRRRSSSPRHASFRSREVSRVRACSPIRSCAVGRITCR